MRSPLTRALGSASVTCAAAPVVRRLMLKMGTLDVPNHRSSHTVPVPRGGGLACLAGALSGLALHPRVLPTRDISVVVGLALVGWADDHSGGLGALPRLVVQSAAGLVCGIQHSPGVALAGALLLPGAVNVVNFMDGINGITGSTALVWGAFAATDPTSTDAIRALGAVAAGTGVGFLPHNAPDAHLFLGDVGSYLFGAIMGISLIEASQRPMSALRLGAPLVPYAVDAAQAIYRRARRRAALFEAHREHVYQRIVDDHEVSHIQMSAIHAATATAVGLLVRSRYPVLAIGGSVAVSAAYGASPALLGYLRRVVDE